jgi:hypothetical protein
MNLEIKMSKNTNSILEKISSSKFGTSFPSSLGELEDILAANIREEIGQMIESSEPDPPEATTRCRECGEVSNYTSQQPGTVTTKFGPIGYWRSAYTCTACGRTTYPLDERLNPVASLARLHTRILAGKSLPVSELAQAWGLGTLDIFAGESQSASDRSLAEEPLHKQALNTPISGSSHIQLRLASSA